MMNNFWKIPLSILVVGTVVGCSSSEPSSPSEPSELPVPEETRSDSEFPYEMETLVEGLDIPWEMEFAPDGRIFLTERSGQIRIIKEGQLLETPAYSFDEPFISRSEGGLLGLELDPDFQANGYVYAYHTYNEEDGIYNQIVRLVADGDELVFDDIILQGIPGDSNHNGGRIKFGPDGYLYVTTGERYEPDLAQDPESLGGKILRMTADGEVPESNPFPSSLVYSLGHRNAQGLAWHPETGKLYSSEHGQSAHDEINLIEPGENYGWPVIEGDEEQEGMRRPLIHSGTDTWAPSGMTFISQGPWKGKLLVANLRGTQVLALTWIGPDFTEVDSIELLWEGELGRIRNVVEGPDGSIYLMTNNRDGRGQPQAGDDKLIRLVERSG